MKNIAIIGAGNMGITLIQGLLESKTFTPEQIIATRKRLHRISFLEEKGVILSQDNAWAVRNAECIILAVKPHLISSVLNEIRHEFTEKHTLISIATGVSLDDLKNSIPKEIPIYRAMPNTASGVKEGITCICTEDKSEENLKAVMHIFQQIGEVIVIEEKLMDSATVIGACGIAYAMRFMRAMMQGAIEIGFDAKTAATIVAQMVKGSAEILIQNQSHPEEEIDKVTTPMGCTITGLNEMEHQGFSSALIRGIVASYDKIEK